MQLEESDSKKQPRLSDVHQAGANYDSTFWGRLRRFVLSMHFFYGAGTIQELTQSNRPPCRQAWGAFFLPLVNGETTADYSKASSLAFHLANTRHLLRPESGSSVNSFTTPGVLFLAIFFLSFSYSFSANL